MALLAAAALAGFAVLAIEILGVHLVAPWFGTSSLVWSNQIGIVLLAMAIGGWLGGAMAKKAAQPTRVGGQLLVVAGVLVAAGLWLLPLVAAMLLPEGLTLDEAGTIFLGGSLGTAILFFAPPVLLLAMLSPLLVEARATQAKMSAGQAAGGIGAAGTLGSLLGVFGSSLIAIPMWGTRTTLALTSVALIVGGILLLRRGRRDSKAVSSSSVSAHALWLALVPAAAAFATSDPADAANLPADSKVMAVQETALQRLRIIEYADGERWLQMNEGLDSYQSRWFPDQRPWVGGYYDLFALAPIYADCLTPGEAPAQFWVLGFGAGSSLYPIAQVLKEQAWKAVGVEIDPVLCELVAKWMPLPDALQQQLNLIRGGDARAWLRAAPSNLDFVLLDSYTNQFEIPLHLATEEFFAEVHQHLKPGGVLAINLGTTEKAGSDLGFTDAIRSGLGKSFGANVRLHQVPRSRNWVAFARKGKELASLEQLTAMLPDGVPASVGSAVLPGQTLDGSAVAGGRDAFTDDCNPLALAQAKLWLGGGGAE
jgi:predicted membrane-bound spermidine synthase